MERPHISSDKTQRQFYAYYEKESMSDSTISRFETVMRVVSKLHSEAGGSALCDVADIGCGAGTNSMIWARNGHTVHALDVDAALVGLGKQRAESEGLHIDFRVGTAARLPWDDESMDICLAPELLEHVQDWQSCVHEFCRILKPGGVLYLSTTNKLCPAQQEYYLPLYSWYPEAAKRYFEKLARTKLPIVANYATHPAMHWFSFYQLRDYIADKGFRSLDRFDAMDLAAKGWLTQKIVAAIRLFRPLRFLAHVATPYTVIFAIKADRG